MPIPLPLPRIHFYEIDDQAWLPPFIRTKVQACLTLFWTTRFWPFQSISPASLVAGTLQDVLGPSINDYTFVDFCSGAAGPTATIEREVNSSLRSLSRDPKPDQGIPASAVINGELRNRRKTGPTYTNGVAAPSPLPSAGIPFILTDLHPHLPAWRLASRQSLGLHYIPSRIDATSTPPSLLSLVQPPLNQQQNLKMFRLYSLAFHHFPQPLARSVLQNTLCTSSGFAIFELQARTLDSVFTVLLLGPMLWLGSWWWFGGDWGHLFWTYVVPVVPGIVVFDGLVSCLRTRKAGELMRMVEDLAEGERKGWRFEWGGCRHTWPCGEVIWFVGIKE
ncbi:MAG: hypothetical protein LQ342_005492 [Letrouitia transgressa]|nr:MAG: hypothetical protein LQ342_005492 [Letrouitia transgressa]